MESSNPDGDLLECPIAVEAEGPVLTKTHKSPERLLELWWWGRGVSVFVWRGLGFMFTHILYFK